MHPIAPYPGRVHLDFSGEMWFWKGPAPWHFVTVPDEECRELEAIAAVVTYGWGGDPRLRADQADAVDDVLVPEGGRYVVPVKAWVRKAEGLEVGDLVSLRLSIDV